MVYSGNFYLNHDQMLVNAQYILNYLVSVGWTKNAVCGALGNMETESTFNPGIWQGLNEGNLNGGYGLVQWTPATKYLEWADSRQIPRASMDSNIERILWEVANNQQWSNSRDPKGRTFAEFTISTDSAYSLGRVFSTAYEKQNDQSEEEINNRGVQARKWFTVLTTGGGGGVVTPPTLPTPSTRGGNALYHMLLSDTINGWK